MNTPQARAIAYVTGLAAGEPLDPAWRVTLHFHPDRLVRGRPILAAMARDGMYRSQFETGTGNGGLTAYVGGDRWRWESRMFAGAYDDGSPGDRPKYGSLNFRSRRIGGSPRFGSAHLRLAPHTLARTTFCYPDSVFEPAHFGVAARVSPLVALAHAEGRDPLDDYVEAHVHGVVDLGTDVEALVLDRASGVPASSGRHGRCAARSSGTAASHCPQWSFAGTRTTAARSTSSSGFPLPGKDFWTRASSARRRAPGGTTSRH